MKSCFQGPNGCVPFQCRQTGLLSISLHSSLRHECPMDSFPPSPFNCDDSLIGSRRLPRTEQFPPGRVTNGDNCGMLQLSLGTNGVELRSYIIGCADSLESFLFSKLGLDDRWQRKYTCTAGNALGII
jgi:hypothetical protein